MEEYIMKKFNMPEINIEMLSSENIITTSANPVNVDIAKANLAEAGVNEAVTQVFAFDELVETE